MANVRIGSSQFDDGVATATLAEKSLRTMSLLIALVVVVIVQLILHAAGAHAVASYFVAVGLGIATLIMVDRKRGSR